MLTQVQRELSVALPPSYIALTSGTTYTVPYQFKISAGLSVAITAGATYTDGTTTYTMRAAPVGAIFIQGTGSADPVSTTLTRTGGSGDSPITFISVAKPSSLSVRMVGGGQGGFGSGSGGANAYPGGNGNDTTFGTSLLLAKGANNGSSSSLGGLPGRIFPAGGFNNGGSNKSATAATYLAGGVGGSSPFGGNGAAGQDGGAGGVAQANSGSGGGGGSGTNAAGDNWSGPGGIAGDYLEAIVTTIATSYTFAIGAGGVGGTGALENGGAGGSGVIIITESY